MAQQTANNLKKRTSRQYHNVIDSNLNKTDGGTVAGTTTFSSATPFVLSGLATGSGTAAGGAPPSASQAVNGIFRTSSIFVSKSFTGTIAADEAMKAGNFDFLLVNNQLPGTY